MAEESGLKIGSTGPIRSGDVQLAESGGSEVHGTLGGTLNLTPGTYITSL